MGRARDKISGDGGKGGRSYRQVKRQAVGKPAAGGGEPLGEVVVVHRPHLLWYSWGYPINVVDRPRESEKRNLSDGYSPR